MFGDDDDIEDIETPDDDEEEVETGEAETDEDNTEEDEADTEEETDSEESDEESELGEEPSHSDEEEEGVSNTKLKRTVHYMSKDNEKLRAENERLRKENEQYRPKLVEPKRDDFDDIDEYIAKRDEYIAEKTRREASEASAKEDQQRQEQQRYDDASRNWENQLRLGREKYDDYDEVHLTSELQTHTGVMAQFFMENEIGAELSYRIHNNPQKYGIKSFEDMQKLSATQQNRILFAAEAKVRAEMKDNPSNKKPVSGAPEPTPKPKPKSRPKSEPSEKDSTDDYIRKRQAQRHKRR